MDNLITLLYNYIECHGIITCRQSSLVKEVFGHSVILSCNRLNIITENDLEFEEYKIYKEMSLEYRDIFIENLKDKYSRRLIIQIPMNYHYKRDQQMMPCIESFAIFYINDNDYYLTINFRSSDLKRLQTDLRIIYTICKNVLMIKGALQQIHINFFNLHKYI